MHLTIYAMRLRPTTPLREVEYFLNLLFHVYIVIDDVEEEKEMKEDILENAKTFTELGLYGRLTFSIEYGTIEIKEDGLII